MFTRIILACLLCTVASVSSGADAYEEAPIHYSTATPTDAAQKIMQELASGKIQVDRTDAWSVLRDLMRLLEVPEASQMLVFSKTSKQNHLINPNTPRMVFFGDNAYIGYCLGGSIEVITIDPLLGPVFYLVEPHPPQHEPIRFVRDQSCLSCHGGPFVPDVPAVLVRSVFPSPQGHPIMNRGSTLVGTATPINDRWGGWYVTGQHSKIKHRGNRLVEEDDPRFELPIPESTGLENLDSFFNTQPYPRPTSDIVALMIFEHQTHVQNVLTKSNHSALRAMHRQQSLQRELGETVNAAPEGSALRIIDNCATNILDALLFKDEASLPDGGLDGDPEFQSAFSKNAPHTREGRSLKDLQLNTRLFKFRCSYMIHSISFQNLTTPLKNSVLAQLDQILQAPNAPASYPYLGDAERRHIRQILVETGVLSSRP